jgi:uncharacterized GH25 family protein
MKKDARILVPVVLVLALVVVVASWLMQGREGGFATPAHSDATSLVAEMPTTEAVDATAPEPLHVDPDAAPLPSDAAAPAEAGAAVTFTGRVLDEAGRPVPGAEVVHVPSDPELAALGLTRDPRTWLLPWERFARTRTDALGRFALPTRELPPVPTVLIDLELSNLLTHRDLGGSLPRLLVMHAGFEPALFHAHAFGRGSVEVGDLVVRLGGALSGRLVDADGQPVPGASVCVSAHDDIDPEPRDWRDTGSLPRTTSDPDGRFLLASLWGATFSAEILADGFVPERPQVTVRTGETRDLGDVVLERGHVIAGWVVASTGEPLADAHVRLRPANIISVGGDADAGMQAEQALIAFHGDQYELCVTTAADGSFRATGVGTRRSSTWHVIATADEREPALRPDVHVGDESVRLELAPAAVIVLHVVEASGGAAIAGATVKARRLLLHPYWKDDYLPLSCTARGDAWRIVGVGPGRNQVVVSAPGHATVGLLLPGVELGHVLEQSVELPPETACSGTVVDEQDAPVAGARISVKPAGEVGNRIDGLGTRADGQGRFELRGLGQGEWLVCAQAVGCVPAAPVRLTLGDGARTGLKIVLARGGRIAGRVVARDRRSLPGREVLAAPADLSLAAQVASSELFGDRFADAEMGAVESLHYKGIVDDRGAYAIDGLPAGEYRVRCEPGGEGTVQVSAGREAALDLVLREPPRVRGRVLAGGVPLRDASVQVALRDERWGDREKTCTSNVAGEYELVLDDDRAGLEIHASALGTRTRSVQLHPRFDDVELIDLVFGGGVIEGTVVDERGAPLQADVTWRASAREGFSEEDEVLVKGSADAAGRFRLELVPAGRGRLQVKDGIHVRVRRDDLVVRDGETSSAQIVLHDGGRVELHLGEAPGAEATQWIFDVHSLADASWSAPTVFMKPGETATVASVPPGPAEVEVRRSSEDHGFLPVRTVPITVVVGQTVRFDQPATE